MWTSQVRRLGQFYPRDIQPHCGFYVPKTSTLPAGIVPIFTEMNIYQNQDKTFRVYLEGPSAQLNAFISYLASNSIFAQAELKDGSMSLTADAQTVKKFVTEISQFDKSMIMSNENCQSINKVDNSFIDAIHRGIDLGLQANLSASITTATTPGRRSMPQAPNAPVRGNNLMVNQLNYGNNIAIPPETPIAPKVKRVCVGGAGNANN